MLWKIPNEIFGQPNTILLRILFIFLRTKTVRQLTLASYGQGKDRLCFSDLELVMAGLEEGAGVLGKQSVRNRKSQTKPQLDQNIWWKTNDTKSGICSVAKESQPAGSYQVQLLLLGHQALAQETELILRHIRRESVDK